MPPVIRLVILCALLSIAAPGAQGTKPQLPPGWTELDGSRDPSLIPDHVVWRMAFNFLAEIKRNGEEADIVDLLPLSKRDLVVLHDEALKQRQRDEQCEARYRATEAGMKEARASSDRIDAALDEVLIGCRTEVLEASDRVLDVVSDDGRQILLTFCERRRRTTSSLVPPRELKNFRLPR